MKMAVLALPASLVALSAQQPDVNKLIAAKDWAGLEAHARARIAAKPKDGAAQNLLGIALGNQGKAAEARAAFEAAVALDPKLGQAWFNLILDRAGAGDGPGTRKAFAELKKASLVIAARAADEKPVFAALADPSLPTLEWTLGEKSPVKPPPAPAYPFLAATAGISGDVVLEVLIDSAGAPTRASMLGGPPQLGAISESLGMKWRFGPQAANGKAVASRAKIAFAYRIESGICKFGAGPDLASAASSLQTIAKGAPTFR